MLLVDPADTDGARMLATVARVDHHDDVPVALGRSHLGQTLAIVDDRVEVDDKPVRVRRDGTHHELPVVGAVGEVHDDAVVDSLPRRRADTVNHPTVDGRNREASCRAGVVKVDHDSIRILEPEHLECRNVRRAHHHPGRIGPVVDTNTL